MRALGTMRERLVIQRNDPPALAVTLVTRSGSTATVTTAAPHGYATGDYVTVAGAAESAYNGRVRIAVTGVSAFTFTVAGTPTTPATGTMTVTYVSDAQGGRRTAWRTLDTIAAELVPMRATERLQAAAIQIERDYRFRTRVRGDVVEAMRALWTPSWPPGQARQVLAITGVLPDDDGRTYMFLECAKAAA